MARQAIWESITYRKRLIGGYVELIQRSMEQGFNAYLLSFMFKPLPGSRKTVLSQMHDEVQRVHSTFVTRVARNPRSNGQKAYLPFLITVPDCPIFTENKHRPQDVKINNGLHLHGVLCTPCNSRLKVDVPTHFRAKKDSYVKKRLLRIDVKSVYSADVVDYAFKALKNGNASPDDIQIYR
jgi:hypothetical protein